MAVTAADQITRIPRIILSKAIDPERSAALLKSASYYRCTAYKGRPYLFDGAMKRFGEESEVFSDDYIPMRKRQPCLRLDLPKVIVGRLTSMVFGHARFPTLKIEGDEDAQDYARELAKEARLPVKMIEARNKGGAAGSVALSWGFTGGRPIVEVHESAFLEVLEWADYELRRPGAVLKAYEHTKRVADKDGRFVEKKFWYARYWDSEIDITWDAIPKELAETKYWMQSPGSKVVRHRCGICPVYWVQNLPDSDSIDGMSDYDGQEDCFAEGDTIYSATAQGTKANVDPTLLIKDDPGNNEGVIKKGSQHAVYSKNGANYLELSGSAAKAGLELVNAIRRGELDKASVIIPDPDKLAALGISGAALALLYLPMLTKCDLLRDQYGNALTEMLKDMLTVSQKLREEPQTSAEGKLYWARVTLQPRVEKLAEQTNMIEREPGSSTNISLTWPPYFPASWKDRKEAITAAKEGTGGQQVVSQETAVGSLASMLDIEDTEAELERIEQDKDANVERARQAFEAGAPRVPTHEEDQNDKGGEGSREAETPT